MLTLAAVGRGSGLCLRWQEQVKPHASSLGCKTELTSLGRTVERGNQGGITSCAWNWGAPSSSLSSRCGLTLPRAAEILSSDLN